MKTLTFAIALLAANAAFAHEYKVGDLSVGHPYAFETTGMARTGAGYLSVTNNGDTADRLIEVRADFPRVMMHETVETDGVARMERREAFEIAPGETLTFSPGGRHVMFMGLDGDPFEAGEKIGAILVFEKAGELPVTFDVETRKNDAAGMGHSDHDM